MAHRARHDEAGSWHHVLNRGLAKRPLLEDRVDVRYFLSRLACEVRRGRSVPLGRHTPPDRLSSSATTRLQGLSSQRGDITV